MEEVRAIVRCQPTPQPKGPDVRATQMNVKLSYNVCYIVCGVVVERGRVLLVQEAKPSCRGQWYLPAGRMEKNETIAEAVKREVKEESGLDFEPETLLSVECQSYSWVRFTLGGRIVGGQLKTVAQADKESLQAQWHPVDKAKLLQTVELRCHDILSLVEIAREWYDSGRPFRRLPVAVGHVSCSLRLVVVYETPSHSLEVLRRDSETENQSCLPVFLMNHERGRGIKTAVKTALEDCGYKKQFSVVGVLQLEHIGRLGTEDGFCMSIVVKAESRELSKGARWRWDNVVETEEERLLRIALQKQPSGCTALIDLSST